MRGYGTPQAEPIRAIDADTLAELAFPAGSMGPKVDACVWFARASGQPAAIGALTDAAAVLAGHTGSAITPRSTADSFGAERR